RCALVARRPSPCAFTKPIPGGRRQRPKPCKESDMADHVHYFFFGVYPYIALAVFLFGSLARFEREQYTWKSDSSQLLKRGALRWGSNLFHLGIISLSFTHLVGLLTPPAVYHALGLSTHAKQAMAVF